MQGCAQVALAIIGVVMFFWALGFWWGIGMLVLMGLIAVANGKE